MTEFSVPGPDDSTITLNVAAKRPLFLVGRNGTGKSALMNYLRQQSTTITVYLPGSRTALFDSENMSLTTTDRQQLFGQLANWDRQDDTRWKNTSGNIRNEKAIFDLVAAENSHKIDCANVIIEDRDPATTSAAIEKLQAKNSPLDKVNMILEQANIQVRMVVSGDSLMASSGGYFYSYARMSDGERIALILIAEVVSADEGVTFLIDEPELHLHRLIVSPLMTALIKLRSDCEFVIGTHELDLPTYIVGSRICIVRSITWAVTRAVDYWDLDIIDDIEYLPEELVFDILGSRRRVLFTEGISNSLDVPMYSCLFPNVSIRPKGSCKDVVHAVKGVKSTVSLHRAEAYGLIDNDGMSCESIQNHQDEGVYALPFFSVESLYYDIAVLTAVAKMQAATFHSDESKQPTLVAELLAKVVDEGVTAAAHEGTAQHLAGRLAERQVRDAFLSQMPRREELIATPSATIRIIGQNAYPEELACFHEMVAARNIQGIISRYPVRHSGILNGIAKALKFQGRSDYEIAAIARISSDKALRDSLLLKLEPLSTVIGQ